MHMLSHFPLSKVMSPVTGRVIGTSEVRVVKSKEVITGLRVKVITGIGLAVTQEVNSNGNGNGNNGVVAASSSVNIFSVETTLTDKLNSKYQVRILSTVHSTLYKVHCTVYKVHCTQCSTLLEWCIHSMDIVIKVL